MSFNKTELKERGWTDGLIPSLLPPPVVEERHSSIYGGYIVHLWSRVIVAAKELTKVFREAQARRKRTTEKLHVYRDVDLLAAIFTVTCCHRLHLGWR